MPTIPNPAIDAHGVTCRYGTRLAVDGVDLAIRRGEITALLGPNGAGKTSFVHLVLGRLQPDAGRVRTLGERPGSQAARAATGAMLQAAALAGQLSVREHLELFSGYYADPEPLPALLARSGLAALAERRYAALSVGQQRRVQFAIALCGRPQLLVLDEPTVGMDLEARQGVWAEIRAAAAAGTAVLLTTHLLEEADALADRIVLLTAGRIVADDTPAAIRGRVAGGRIRCRTALTRADIEALPGIEDVELSDSRLEARSLRPEETLRALLGRDATITDLEVERASLEEALAHIAHREAA
jgi:ABC-2 type transport system ATP-binding protein